VSAPSVYAAIHAVASDFAECGIAKAHTNVRDGYDYRSIDDVQRRLAPLLAKHRLCIFPRVVEHNSAKQIAEGDVLMWHVTVRARFAFVSVDDGTSHDVVVYGEALDAGDKATPKAMSAAYKSAILQTFCVPVADQEDVDASSPRLMNKAHLAEPVQGWHQWSDDIIHIVDMCESEMAIDTVQERNRALLVALRCERPELYAHLGKSVIERRDFLSKRARQESLKKPSSKHGEKATSELAIQLGIDG
jgi:hypothetical protein